MKRILSILMVVTMAFAGVSCGDDDGPTRPKDMPNSVEDSKNYSYELLSQANSTITIGKEIKLTDFSQIKKDWIQFVNEAKVRSSSKMMISGIKKGDHKIKNLTLKVKGTNIVKRFANDEGFAMDGTFNFVEDQNFMQNLMNELVAEKTITIELTATTEKKINNDVKISLDFNVLFKL